MFLQSENYELKTFTRDISDGFDENIFTESFKQMLQMLPWTGAGTGAGADTGVLQWVLMVLRTTDV